MNKSIGETVHDSYGKHKASAGIHGGSEVGALLTVAEAVVAGAARVEAAIHRLTEKIDDIHQSLEARKGRG